MPRGDRTGPLGEGPMTGRAAGYCDGQSDPDAAISPASGRGAFARLAGRRHGRGMGPGGGRGHRNRFFATGVPFSAIADQEAGPFLQPDDEIPLLKKEAQRLKSMMETVDKRLKQLETK